MDVCYVLKSQPASGSVTAELRYSLRSLRNLPHDRVVVAGWKPDWLRNVLHVPTVQRATKWQNALTNLQAALSHLSDDFVLMNDDFFILEPMERIPALHREQWGKNPTAPNGAYQLAKANVRKILAKHGITEAWSYELHVPMPYNRALLERTLKAAEGLIVGGYQRSLYGNLNRIGGTQVEDCKVSSLKSVPDGPFVSTTERSFRSGKVGAAIKAMFPDPSPYES